MTDRRLDSLIDLALVAGVCLACFLMGKDLNIDMLSYHLYSAHAFWTGTYASTFMGAGSQSYINPVGYLPFYAMIRADWHSLVIALILAAAAATALLSLWRMGRRWLFAGHPHARALSVSGAVLGGLSPLFLATAGTSFLDPLQAALFCLALVLTAIGLERDRAGALIAGGFVLGVATGLKLSFVHLAAATLVALLVVPGRAAARGRRFLLNAAGAGAGLLASAGFWAAYLYKTYGNPVFPFANGIFRSPDFPAVSIGLDRFAAESMLDLALLPWRMASLKSGVYAEIPVPDIRFALLVLLAIALLALARRRRSRGEWPPVPDSQSQPVRIYLGAVLGIGYVTWVLTSGNGRYFLPLLLLVGPAVIWLASLVFRNPKHLLMAVVLMLAAQFIHGGAFHYRRWDQTAWTPRWLDLEVPGQLAQTPHRYLFTGSESDTFVAPFLHPDSRYLMIQGKNPLSPNREGAHRVRAFLTEPGPELRVLVRESETRQSKLYQTSTPDPVTLALINDDLAAWNLQVSDRNCLYVGVTLGRSAPATPQSTGQSAWPREYSLLSCPVLPGSALDPGFHAQQARLEKMADALALACPVLFPAPPSFPVRIGELWFIRYAGSDVVVAVRGNAAVLTRTPMGPFNAPIGEVDALSQGRLGVECRRLPRR